MSLRRRYTNVSLVFSLVSILVTLMLPACTLSLKRKYLVAIWRVRDRTFSPVATMMQLALSSNTTEGLRRGLDVSSSVKLSVG